MPGKELVPLAAAPPSPGTPGMPWPQQERRSESAVVASARWAKRNRHLTVPLAILPAMWLAGLVFRQAHAVHAVAGCGTVLALCVCFFAPHKWDRPAEQWYARLSAILGAAWLTAAAAIGPLASPMTAEVLGGVLFAGCTVWGWFWWQHKRPRGMKKRKKVVAQCDAWWQSHAWRWGLSGSSVIDAKLSGVTLWMRIQGIGGSHTLQQFRQAIPLIESAAEGQADIGLVRVEPVKGHPSQVDLYLKQDNPLRGTVEYDETIAPRSVHQPAPMGKTETAEWKMMGLRINRFTIGKTRSGKSNDLLVGVANLSGCPDARFVLIDLKGARSGRPVVKSGAAEYVITEVDEARMFLRMMTAEAKARQMDAYDGNEQLTATPAIPALFVLIDETYGLTATEDGAGDPECRRHVGVLASQGSGVELYVWIYTQHGSLETSVGTEQIRGNLAMRTCYRVEEARHGAYVIPEYNRLDASKLAEQGTCYVKDGPEVTPEQVRAPLMEHAALSDIAARNTAMTGGRPPLHLFCGDQTAYETEDGPVTWQQWWDARWMRLHPKLRSDSPQYQAAAPQDIPQDTPPAQPHVAPAATIIPDSSPVPDDFRPDPELVRLLPQVIASQVERFCDALEAATADSPATPRDLMSASGFAKSWVHDRLGALQEIGQVGLISRGRYYTLPGADIRDGLAEIKARNDRLNREAQDMINAA